MSPWVGIKQCSILRLVHAAVLQGSITIMLTVGFLKRLLFPKCVILIRQMHGEKNLLLHERSRGNTEKKTCFQFHKLSQTKCCLFNTLFDKTK